MQFQYDTNTSTTVNNHGLLARPGDWPGDVSVYLWAIRTCYECQRHRKRHRKSLHEIIELGSM